LFSKTIGTKQAKELIEKLKSMGNRYFQAKVSHVSNLPGLQHTDNKQLMYVLDKINDVISQKRKISFIYNEYGTDFKLHPKREEGYVVNPYQMVANNGFYYLIGNYDKYNDISHYRMDRMTCVEILPDKVKPQDQIEGLENGLNLPKHMANHIYMFSGDSVLIKMLAAESLINELVDWFGKDFRIYEKYPDNQVMVSLKCNEHAFFYWALQYGPYVEVLELVSLRNRFADAIRKMNEKYHKKRILMNNIEFHKMNEKKRSLYEGMWGSSDFDYPVEKTIYRGAPTDNSYTFSRAYINDKNVSEEIQEDCCRDRLAEIFGIVDTELFKDKFHMSIGGSGRELKRIATVHSSSLCALLFFYGVYKRGMFDRIKDAKPLAITYHKGSQRSYIFLVHDKDYENYRRILNDFVNGWDEMFTHEVICFEDTTNSNCCDRFFEPETIVQHFKRELISDKERAENMYLYKIKGTAIHSETREKLMIYQALYDDMATYVRPYDMFMGEVDHKKYPDIRQRYRFEEVHDD